jgi:Spy/CpxP family protein refolding chaperone
MKTLSVAAAAIAVVSIGLAAPSRAHAQPPGRPGFGAQFGGGAAGLLELPPAVQAKLKLTEEQKTRIAAIRTKSQEDVRNAFQGAAGGGDRQAAFRAMTEARRKAETDAVALLTADQKKQLDELKTQAQQYQGLGREAVALLAVDGLTADQQGQLKKLATDAQAKRQEALRSLQGGGGGGGALRGLQQLQTETTAAIRKILTADQAKQFDAVVATLPAPGRGLGRPRPPGNDPR